VIFSYYLELKNNWMKKDLIRSKIWQRLFRQLLKVSQKRTMRTLSRVGESGWNVV